MIGKIDIGTSVDLYNNSIAEVAAYKEAIELGHTRYIHKNWDIEPFKDHKVFLEKFKDQIIYKDVSLYSVSIYMKLDLGKDSNPVVVWITVKTSSNPRYSMTVGAFHTDDSICEAAIEMLKKILPEAKSADELLIDVNFWVLARNGAKQTTRPIHISPWKDIASNYSEATKKYFDEKIANFKPNEGGQMMLFSGEPGVGKTFALMSLFHSWKSWAKFNYIVDPITFFGGSPDYLTSVLFDEKGYPFDDDDDDKDRDKWRVFILEDVGELIHPGGKDKVGQGLGQLLNTTSGLIGRGLKILFILTTNDTIEKLDPAVSRPGRCVARLEFEYFSKDEANAWLASHDSKETVNERKSIAELYAVLNNATVQETETINRKAGFLP